MVVKNVIEKAKDLLGIDKQEEDTPTFVLLPDKPIEPDKEKDIRFGHKDLVETLVDLTTTSNPPLTIGLYGNWGTGKTTIAKSVQEKVEKKDDFKTLYFDTWKYERDSLRRQFLIELDSQIFSGKLKFKEELNKSLTRAEDITFWDYVERLSSNLVIRVLGIASLFSLAAWIYLVKSGSESSITALVSGVTQLGLLGTVVSFILKSFDVVRGSTQEPRTDSAEGFESHFISSFQKSELKNKTLFVIVDNLDRVDDSKVIEVLSDIKTFLTVDSSEQKVVFLIPCDYDSLRVRLGNLHGNDFNADEFFRKFFNLSLRISKFVDLDLFNYIKELLKETKVKEYEDNPELVGVLYSSLKENPREIKQFINSLTTQVLLARKRNLDMVLENVAFLAKLLVIRQKFPTLYSVLEEKSVRSVVTLDDDDLLAQYQEELSLMGWEEKQILRETDSFSEFNKLTPGVNEDSFDVFVSLHISEDERSVPEWTSYVIAAESGNFEDADKVFSQIKKDSDLNVFDKLLKIRIDKLRKGSPAINLVATTLKVLEKHKHVSKEFFDEAANHFPYGDDINETYDDFYPDLVFRFWYKNTSKYKRSKIVTPYAHLMNEVNEDKESLVSADFALSFFGVLADIPTAFSGTVVRTSIRKAIQEMFYIQPYITLLKSTEARKNFIDRQAGAMFVDSLEVADFKNLDELKSALDLWQNTLLTKDAVINSFKKYHELTQSFLQEIEESKMLLEISRKFMQFSQKYVHIANSEIAKSDVLKTQISAISASIGNLFDKMEEPEKKLALPVLDYLMKWQANDNQHLMVSRVENFIESSEDETILSLSMRQLHDWAEVTSLKQALIKRCATLPELFIQKRIHEKMKTVENEEIIVGMVGNRFDPIESLKAVSYKVDDNDYVIGKFIDEVPNMKLPRLTSAFEIMKTMGINSMSERIEELKLKLIENLTKHSDEKSEIQKLIKDFGIFNEGQLTDIGLN